ncbi:Hypothetical predicted protein [Paramuricea clavata]|uniref:Uncharacterized protein n=1 Tax=Paramuricea clavata TaxID=317549 RepID=A0A7D9DGV5_PARCT|nr:Hypothetical predicted protein [Paramuricea clavata]
MFTYLAQYSPHLSEKTAILREDTRWNWCPEHEAAFTEMKNIITQVPGPVLKYYDTGKHGTVQLDASQSGLEAVLLQDGKPVTYASKALTPTQQAYVQLEKEALALVFGCEKFHHYLLATPLRVQRMRIRLQKHNVTVKYKPGKDIPVAGTLSRSGACEEKPSEDQDLESYVGSIVKEMPVSDGKMEEIRDSTKRDEEL